MGLTCEHCGTAFTPAHEEDRYCCKGCECVANMIRDGGHGRFYDLLGSTTLAPVKGRPFENPDLDWLKEACARAEAVAREKQRPAVLDCSLEGLSCVACVWLVERLFERQPGALRAIPNPARGSLRLEWRPGLCDLPAFASELVSFGYTPAPPGPDTGRGGSSSLVARTGLCFAFALNAMGFTLPTYLGMGEDFAFAPLFQLVAFLSASLAMLVGGAWFISRAWRALRAGSVHIDLPIALGLIASYVGSVVGWLTGNSELVYFDFVCTFVFLMLAGRWLQTLAVERNRRRLARRSPLPASVLRAGAEPSPIALGQIRVGDSFQLEQGRALPVAATLLDPIVEVSLEWISGESEATLRRVGAVLPAGAIHLGRDPVVVRAEETWQDSLLSRLTDATEPERSSPGLDRLLRVYLLVVLTLGLAGFAFWLPRAGVGAALQVAISVFVVSCPCALGVAIPFADERATRLASRLGVFVRNTVLWPRLRKVRKVVFDKTGTLTLERPLLENPGAVEQLDDESAAALAVLATGSFHPVCRSLVEALGHRGQRLLKEGEAHRTRDGDGGRPREEAGMGVAVSLAGAEWTLGRSGWSAPGEAGATVLARDGRSLASFTFRDAARPDAVSVVAGQQLAGREVHILSGDHPGKVEILATALGVPPSQAHGGLSPEGKAELLRGIDRHDTLYLGDGANDSLAFDLAWVSGTPVADRSLLENKADFFTLGDSLGWLPGIFGIARARTRGIRTAFAFALVYNLATVAVSLAGHMNPLLATILMPLSSIVSLALAASPTVAEVGEFRDVTREARQAGWPPPKNSSTVSTVVS